MTTRYCSQGAGPGAGGGGGKGEHRRWEVLTAMQETLDKGPQRAQLLGDRGKGQTDGLGLAGSKSRCGGGCGV